MTAIGTVLGAAAFVATLGLSSTVAAQVSSSFDLRRSTEVVVTNTLPLPPEKQLPNLEGLSVARIIADAIDAVFEDTSVSEIFGGENLA